MMHNDRLWSIMTDHAWRWFIMIDDDQSWLNISKYLEHTYELMPEPIVSVKINEHIRKMQTKTNQEQINFQAN